MPEQVGEQAKPFDPFESIRGMRDAYLESISKTMVEAVNSESYAQATGAMLDYALSASAPFREALERSMAQTLQQLSLPSRQDVAALAERFTNVEMRLDDLDAKIDRVLQGIAKAAPPRNGKRQTRPRKAAAKRA
jgi:polyhydroxyalkanoate synthesis regulator phasin